MRLALGMRHRGYVGQVKAVQQLLRNRHGEANDVVWAYNELEPMRATIAEVAAFGIPVV